MKLHQLIAQMVVVRACGHLYDRQIQYPQWELDNRRLETLIRYYGIGGVILLGGSAPEIYLRTQQLQAWSDHPLLFAADIEEGVGQRFKGGTRFPPPMALERCDPDRAYQMGRITAQEAASIGINWLLAPVADINSNPANPVINVRAFGRSPDVVIPRIRAFIHGAKEHPVLTTAKHFPGHGDTTIDSHLATPSLDKTLEQLWQWELLPFQAAIGAGVDAIMTAHLFLPQIDSQIATLSPSMITQLLRQELGFQGLIVTDALVMAGIRNRHSLADIVTRAILAGNDILLMPPDPIATIDIIYQAVKRGEISPDRIYESVDRIWQYKAKLKSPTNLPNLDSPSNNHFAHNLMQETIFPIHPGQITPPSPWINFIVTDRFPNAPELFPPLNLPGAITLYGEIDHLDYYNLPKEQGLLLQIYTRGNPFQGELGDLNKLVNFLQDKHCLGGILYGNPYLISVIQTNFNQPWLFSYGHYRECQQICLDRLLVLPRSVGGEFTD